MEWLLKNREWFFSGAGLAIISGAIYLIRRICQWRVRRLAPASFGAVTAAETSTRPYPSEITAAIGAAPSLHQETRAREYIGLEVRWLCSLKVARAGQLKTVKLMMLDRGSYPWISCTVALDKNTDLLHALEGKRYWVQGRVSSVSSGTIELDEATLVPA